MTNLKNTIFDESWDDDKFFEEALERLCELRDGKIWNRKRCEMFIETLYARHKINNDRREMLYNVIKEM